LKNLFFWFGLTILAMPQMGYASEVFFSPQGGAHDQILKRIHASTSTIDIAIYVFTSTDTAQALAEAHQRGVKVRVVRDRNQSKKPDDENADLQRYGVLVHAITGPGEQGLMHNTFAIFDGKEVFVGSYNWTANAEHRNWENALFTRENAVVEAYKKEFDVLWKMPDKGP
jgi:phosphatidylserine/phosphatidylglycerophosphate/cardiolipin synthase-like enzyme